MTNGVNDDLGLRRFVKYQIGMGRVAMRRIVYAGIQQQKIDNRLGKGAKLRARVHDLLDDGEQVERRAGQSVDARHRHRHRVGGGKSFQEPEQFAPAASAVGAEAHKLKAGVVGLAIDENKVGPDVAIAMIASVVRERMVEVAAGQGLIRRQQVHYVHQDSIQLLALLS
jgi:hypothetical protein